MRYTSLNIGYIPYYCFDLKVYLTLWWWFLRTNQFFLN